jgi:carbon storage regulator
MLVLSRRVGEEIVINDHIRITVVMVKRGTVRLGVTAPEHVRVDRQEVAARRAEFRPSRTRRPRQRGRTPSSRAIRFGFRRASLGSWPAAAEAGEPQSLRTD